MFFLYHTLSHRLQPEAPQCVCVCVRVCVYKYTCLCVSVCVRETRVCLSAFCHPAIGDSFNCSMTTTRKDQKPHKSQSKLAAVPRWKASHAIITGKKTSSTAAQHRVYLTPITQLCRYPNNNALCPDRTRGCLREKKHLDIAGNQGMSRGFGGDWTLVRTWKPSGGDLDFKELGWIHQCKLHCSESEKRSLAWH